MKRFMPVFAGFVLALVVIIGCKKTNPIPFQSTDITGGGATATSTTVPGATNTPTTGGATNTATSVPTNTATAGGATATPTATSITKTPLFDDMADCDNTNKWGAYWYTYDDSQSDPDGAGPGTAGTSVVWPPSAAAQPGATFIMSSPGRAGAPDCAARITGVVTKLTAPSFQYGFVAMGSQVDPMAGSPTFTSIDISAAEAAGSISFWTMGDGKSYAIKLKADPTVPVGDASYEFNFSTTGTWTQVTVYFSGILSKFTQPSWAPPANVVPIAQVLAKLTDIQFQTIGQPIASIDLWIDDLQFDNCGL